MKALLFPVNSQGQILIQDRRNFKKPDWGFFGGGIEKGETPLEAVIRETKEELGVDLKESDLVAIGTQSTSWNGQPQLRHLFVYPTDQKTFVDYEADGAHWLSFEEASKRLVTEENFNDIIERIKKNT